MSFNLKCSHYATLFNKNKMGYATYGIDIRSGKIVFIQETGDTS